MQLVLFQNEETNLYPLALTQPAFSILCGGFSLLELVQIMWPKSSIRTIIPERLQDILHEVLPRPKRWQDAVLFIDGAIQPDARIFRQLAKKVAVGKPFAIWQDKKIVFARIDCGVVGVLPSQLEKLKVDDVQGFLAKLKLPKWTIEVARFDRIWQPIIANIELLKSNLSLQANNFEKIKPDVFIGQGVTIDARAVLDTTDGPIVIGDQSVVEAYAVLRGPLSIGRRCKIRSFAELKSSTIGDVCKIGGEVENSVVQPYSNKQHYGSLVHSYVGSWVNLGAGTTTSDLKNTYGEIKMQGQSTGQQFLGSVIGDYTKTAIGTLVFTGKVIGVNCMLLGAVATDVPSFTNAGSFVVKPVEFPLIAAHKMQKAMMARRKIPVTAVHRRLLSETYRITASQRHAVGVKAGKLVLR